MTVVIFACQCHQYAVDVCELEILWIGRLEHKQWVDWSTCWMSWACEGCCLSWISEESKHGYESSKSLMFDCYMTVKIAQFGDPWSFENWQPYFMRLEERDDSLTYSEYSVLMSMLVRWYLLPYDDLYTVWRRSCIKSKWWCIYYVDSLL